MKRNKIVNYMLAFAIVLAGMFMGNVVELQAADLEGYYTFPATLFNYDSGTDDSNNPINDELKESNSLWRFKWNTRRADSTSSINNYNENGLKGLVKNQLDDDGKIQFQDGYDNLGILDADAYIDNRDVYTGVQIPFRYVDGYYELNSDTYDVYFGDDDTEGPVSGDTLAASTSRVSVRGKINGYTTDRYGFYPFNNREVGETDADYHFGMAFSTQFFMTEDGKIDGQDITFEFAGDDDVWVFIDKHLVLDIGGIHAKLEGEINFATGQATVEGGTPTSNTTAGTDLWQLLETTADTWRSSSSPHTLQVFYLERGSGDSNCKIKFNLPQKNCVSVTKHMGNAVGSQTNLDKLNELSFEFTAYSSETEDGEGTPFANKVYYLYDSLGNLVGGSGNRTDANGRFTLKFGQTAKFFMDTDIYEGKDAYFYVKEDKSRITLEDISWATESMNDYLGNGKTETSDSSYSPVLKIESLIDSDQTKAIQQYTFKCTNTVKAPQAIDDLVVLDYGKPVLIDVLKNDAIFDKNPLISKNSEKAEKAENGTFAIVNNKLEYKPTQFMDSVDKFSYIVTASDTGSYDFADVQVIPATNVYYEDDFAIDNGGSATIEYSGTYTVESAGTAAGTHQSEENKVYGQDAAYADQNKFSDGSATGMSQGAKAVFTFKGTGVDIYTKTDTASPVVGAWIYKVNADNKTTLKKVVMVDNKYDVAGEGLYQIPTICFEMDEYATYKVELQVMSATGASKYYLDGIRIYNPIDVSAGTEDAIDANEAYQLADEAGAISKEVRDCLLEAGELSNDTASANGIVYLDNVTTGTNVIADYTKDGPKNEVYLSKDNGVAFTLTNYDDSQKVYLGVKAPAGQASQLTVTDGTTVKTIDITSASDMYFPITPTSAGNVVIKNTGEGLLAITKVRVANAQISSPEAQVAMFMVDEDTMAYTQDFATMSLRAANDAETPDVDVDIENPNEGTTGSSVSKVVKLIKNIISGFGKLFGKW